MTNKKALGISCILGAIFLGSALLILSFGHLHEDAYILFQYSKKLSLGEGVVFDNVSGPTEGATDFLWMIMLALMHYLGLNLGVAAALLNSAGLILTSYVILKLSEKFDWHAFGGLLLILFSGGFAAAIGGFSTLAYGGLIVSLGYSVIHKRYKAIAALSLLIPLFRPDGLLLVLGGVVTAFFLATTKEKKLLVSYLVPVAFIGAGYFIWRLNYFDSLLPLPLLVKSKTDTLFAGFWENFNALKIHILLLIPLIMLVAKQGMKQAKWSQYFAVGLGPFLLFVALLFAHQSQNIGGRFQYPIILALILIFILAAKELKNFPKIYFLIPLICALYGAKIIRYDAIYLTNNDYINSFPQMLKEMNFKVDRIAITEAGRFPFWYDAEEMTDLVGLNSGRVVRDGPAQVLNETSPELIFVHQAGRYSTSIFSKEKPFLVTSANSIKIKSEYQGYNTTLIAPDAALKFAIKNNYTAILVQYGERDKYFSHVYFLSPNLDVNLFITALDRSISSKFTYFQSLNL